MDKVYILFNRQANHGKGEEGVEEILREFPKDAVVLDVTTTDVHALVGELDSDDCLVLCGGDGTLNRFANSIRGIDIHFPMYLWRSGTGNDFLNDLELPADEKKIYVNDYLKDLPTVTINDKENVCFINGVGMGLDGFVCEEMDIKKRQGKNANYTLVAVKQLFFGYKRPNATITVDGVTKKYKKVWLVPTMNGRFLGGGMKMAPMQYRMSDKLSCIAVHNAGRLKILALFLTIFKGNHIKHKSLVDWCQGHEITVEFDRPVSMQIDGEVYTNVRKYVAVKPALEEETAKPALAAAEI